MSVIALTYRYRVKGGSSNRRLSLLAPVTNLVWNFCNATSFKAIRDYSKWLSKIDLQELLKGSSKELAINSQSIQAIAHKYVENRITHKKRKLRWRVSKGPKRSSGWIPFNGQTIKVAGNKIRYNGQEYKFWDSWDGKNPKQRIREGEIKTGCFSQDASGKWYLNLTCEVRVIATQHEVQEVGGDLGLKDALVLSDGTRMENPRTFSKHEEKLAGFQRHGKRKQARRLSARIKNIRKDFIHKKTLQIVKKYRTIFLGDLSGKFLQASSGKSSADASTGIIRSTLSYKAIRHQGRVVDVSERSIASTQTCSNPACLKRTGPSGLGMLGVREWKCGECGAVHDRDVNAALNHFRVGRDSLKQPAKVA